MLENHIIDTYVQASSNLVFALFFGSWAFLQRKSSYFLPIAWTSACWIMFVATRTLVAGNAKKAGTGADGGELSPRNAANNNNDDDLAGSGPSSATTHHQHQGQAGMQAQTSFKSTIASTVG